jgi:hypothetical protein
MNQVGAGKVPAAAENASTAAAAADWHSGFDRLSLKGGAEGEDEVSEPQLLDPTPELPDDTPISEVELPTRIRNVLATAGLKTSADFTRVVEQTGVLGREPPTNPP